MSIQLRYHNWLIILRSGDFIVDVSILKWRESRILKELGLPGDFIELNGSLLENE